MSGMNRWRSRAWGTVFAVAIAVGACGGGKGKPGPTEEDGTGGAAGGPSGTGGQPEDPAPPFVDRITVGSRIEKIDLLFMIDNSVSMADKQQILRDAVPSLVRRLVNPACVDQETGEVTAFDGVSCAAGSRREFAPIDDIHIGVITSSLGGHGGPNNVCAAQTESTLHPNDRAELLPNVRDDLPQGEPAGFLRWNGGGQQEQDTLVQAFSSHVAGVAETGCGYEAVLESWYRFLIDPEPPLDMELDDNQQAVPTGINQPLLEQRAAFLRPDSLVAIIMLTDEDDCSVIDGGSNWVMANPTGFRMSVASHHCEEDPNHACCHSCRSAAPAGCDPSPACEGGPASPELLPVEQDGPNTRCSAQKGRFGIDFLYSPSRYVDALTQPTVRNRAGEEVPNPLFVPAPGGMPRDPSLIFLAGIVGVPWQDIGTEDSLEANSDALVFLTAEELASSGRWEVILGNPEANPPVPPTDPLMRVSVNAPRSGTHPITGDALVDGNDAPLGNPINGHEHHPVDDLQFACIFRLPEPILPESCDVVGGCNCVQPGAEDILSPECFDTPASSFGTTQYWAKAYPSPRILQVLRDFGDNSIVASICPKNLELSADDPSYGYNPAMNALVRRLGEVLVGRCLPNELTVDDQGNVPCSIVEVEPSASADSRGCGRPGRGQVTEEVAEAIRAQLQDLGACSNDDECADFSLCTIEPLTGDAREACLLDGDAADFAPGYCYIDPTLGPEAGGVGDGCTAAQPESCTNPLVQICAADERRLLRFVGSESEPTPAPGSTTFIACGDDVQ